MLPYLISMLAGLLLYKLLKPQPHPTAEYIQTNDTLDSANLSYSHKASSNA